VDQGNAISLGPATDVSASDTLTLPDGDRRNSRDAACLSSMGSSPTLSARQWLSDAEKHGCAECRRAAKNLRLVTPDGLAPVRCKAPLKCPYCFGLSRWELVTALFEDATTDCPTAVLTLTTKYALGQRYGHLPFAEARRAYSDDFNRSVEQVIKALRRRWPDVEYAVLIEFTTGEAPTSGHLRRIHAHGLLKGVPDDALDQAQELAREIWRARMGAHRVQLAPLRSCGGIIGYLGGLHHTKAAQRPPAWWRGRTFRASRGYFNRPVAEVRAAAKSAQAERRRLWAAGRTLGAGATAQEIEWAATLDRERSEAHRWRVVRVTNDGLMPLGEVGQYADRGKLTRYHPVDETAAIAAKFWLAVRAGRKARRAHSGDVRSPRRESTTAPAPAAPSEQLALTVPADAGTAAARTPAPPHGRPRGGRAPIDTAPPAPRGITGPAPPGALGHYGHWRE
jgi:hypothetical protein